MHKLKQILTITMAVMMALVFMPIFPGVDGAVRAVSGTAINSNSFAGGPMTISADGSYYLEEDVTGNIIVDSGCTVTLDLNGKVISGGDSGSVITNEGTLTIKDSDKTKSHYYKVNENGLWTLDKEASEGTPYENMTVRPKTGDVIAIKGGAITGGTKGTVINGSNHGVDGTIAVGGGIYSSGDLTADGVVICGNTIDTAGGIGGGLYIDADLGSTPVAIGKATLKDVKISGNTAANGGGVGMHQAAQLLMDGCTVTGNSATEDNTGTGGGIYKPAEQQSDKNAAYTKVVLLNTKISENRAESNGGGVYFKPINYKEDKTCFVKGTLITMTDGTKKKIEDVVVGDEVMTFDHEKGEISSAKVYIAWQEKMKPQVTFKLNFEGGYSVHCVAAHTFLEKKSMKYERFTAENAKNYVGQCFFGEDGQWHKLLSVSIEEDTEWLYEIYTAKHQNAFTDGMLSSPDDVEYMLNIYELDENLKADEAQLAADIKEYGIVSYDYANKTSGGMTSEWYDAAGAKYLFIAIGKVSRGELISARTAG